MGGIEFGGRESQVLMSHGFGEFLSLMCAHVEDDKAAIGFENTRDFGKNRFKAWDVMKDEQAQGDIKVGILQRKSLKTAKFERYIGNMLTSLGGDLKH